MARTSQPKPEPESYAPPSEVEEAELAPVSARVKWFDATRGFGFLVSDDIDGDVLIHFSILREHGRRSVPEGALIECVPVRLERGLQAKKILSIDLTTALPAQPRSSMSPSDRSDRRVLATPPVISSRWR